MFISPEHPHCDCCAMPNSGQEVAIVRKDDVDAMVRAATEGETLLDMLVLLVCRECLATAWREGDAVAPLQREFTALTFPSDVSGLNRWNVLDQMLAEAYWQGWSARSERGFVAAQ